MSIWYSSNVLFCLVFSLVCQGKAIAQIIPDNTLGGESSSVTPINPNYDRIDGGAIRGSNLFHSFREFNIHEGNSAYFSNPEVIKTIFSRVTGNNPSLLLGKLGVLGNANLFFINPNGVIFGQNASLDISGSFVVTTAKSIRFPDGSEFSTVNPQGAPLLTIDVPVSVGLVFEGDPSGKIYNQADLQVGKNLSLIGETIVNKGSITATQGDVTLITKTNAIVQLDAVGKYVETISLTSTEKAIKTEENNSTENSEKTEDQGNSSNENTSINRNNNSSSGNEENNATENHKQTEQAVPLLAENISTNKNNNGLQETIENQVSNSSSENIDNQISNSSSENIDNPVALSEKNSKPETPIKSGEPLENIERINNLENNKLSDNTVDIVNKIQKTDNNELLEQVNDREKTENLLANNSSVLATKPGDILIIGSSDKSSILSQNLIINADNNLIIKDAKIGASKNLSLTAENTLTIRDSKERPIQIVGGKDLTLQGNQAVDIFALNNSNSGLVSGEDTLLKSSNAVGGDAHFFNGGSFRVETLDGELGNLSSPHDPIILTQGDVELFGYQGASLHIIAGGSVNINTIIITGTDTENNTINPRTIPELANVTLSDGTKIVIDGTQKPTLDIRAGVDIPSITDLFIIGEIFSNSDFVLFLTDNIIVEPFDFPANPSSANITIGDVIIAPPNGVVYITNQFEPNSSLSGNITINGNGISDLLYPNNFVKGIDARGLGGRGSDVIIDSRGNINQFGNIDTGSNSTSGGNVRLNSVGNTTLVDNYILTLGRGVNGNSGNVNIEAKSVSLTNGAFISSLISNAGTGGNITINASDSITLQGIDAQGNRSFISSDSTGKGNAGDLRIETSILTLQDGANLSSSSKNEGRGGNITIIAPNSIILKGTNAQGSNSFIVSETEGKGNAGNLSIETGILSLQNGAAISTTAKPLSTGKAGNITIKATDSITLQGINSKGDGSVIQSSSIGKGDAGDLNIETGILSLQNGALISTRTANEGKAGNININATDFITLKGKNSYNTSSVIISLSSGQGDAGNLKIETGTLSLQDAALISSETTKGKGGNLTIIAPESITLEGKNFNNIKVGARISSGTTGNGDAGNLRIETGILSLKDGASINTGTTQNTSSGKGGNLTIIASDSILLQGTNDSGIGSFITSDSGGKGDAGDLILETNILSLKDGAYITTGTLNEGKGGNLTIIAADSITLEGTNKLLNGGGSVISSASQGNSFDSSQTGGDSGDIRIETRSLSLKNGASISTLTSNNPFTGALNTGKAGNITVIASDLITLQGLSGDGIGSSITSDSSTVGDAGDLSLKTSTLFLQDGASITTTTSNIGKGGNITIIAPNFITLQGKDSDGDVSLIVSGTLSKGDSGNLRIETGILSLEDGAVILASTVGEGDAGSIIINAKDLTTLTGQNIQGQGSSIGTTTVGLGNANNITLNTPQLRLSDGARLSARTSGKGNAGDITVNSPIAVNLGNNSQLTVETSGAGKPGNINITTNILNIGKDAQLNATTTATATNRETGGSINLNANQINLSGKLGIFAETQGVAPAGDLTIKPNNTQNLDINFSDNGFISARTFASGQGGDIDINAPQTIDIRGQGKITVETQGSGNAGNITLRSQNIDLADGLEIAASTTGQGSAGNINLNANQINLQQTTVNAVTNSSGNAGSISLFHQGNNANIVSLENSQISTEIQKNGQANRPSNIDIKTDRLTLNNSTITASTQGKGNAGNITVPNAQNINLNQSQITASTSGEGDTGKIDLNTNQNIDLNNSQINSSVEQGARGNSQQITLKTPNLDLNNSTIGATTAGQGNAGSIIVNEANRINLDKSTISTAIETTGIATQPSNITLNTQQLNLDNNSQITASTQGKGNAGNITVPNAQNINLNQSQITASTSGEGDTGKIDLNTNQNIDLNNSQINSSVEQGARGNSQQITLKTPNLDLNNSTIGATTAAQGNAGSIIVNEANRINLDKSTISTAIETSGIATQPSNITLNTQQLNLDNNSQITASTQGKGNAGNITVPNAQNINLNQSEITASTSGEGNAGNINLKTETLNLNNQSQITSTANRRATGDGGDITLQTRNLALNNASKISTSTQGEDTADAGKVGVTAETITLDNNSQIAATTDAGKGGTVNLSANTLDVNNSSQIRTTTTGKNDAGDITAIIRDNITLSGTNSGFFADTGLTSLGKGGNIFIDPIQFTIKQGAAVSVNSQGQGIGGNIFIGANNLTLDNGTISAQTFSTTGGNITLRISDILLMRNGSQISTTAGTANAGGNGGNITIDANLILTNLYDNNRITANAFTGNGGNINITSRTIFGFVVGEALEKISVIDASSALGLDGIININSTIIDPTRSLDKLPDTNINPNIQQGCQVSRKATTVEFYDIGSGGIPINPEQLFTPFPLHSTGLISLETITAPSSYSPINVNSNYRFSQLKFNCQL